MICYSKTASDTKHRVRDLAWLHGRFFAIAAICVAPVCVYFFLAGIISNAPTLIQLGFRTMTLAAVLLAIYFILRSKLNKAVIANFEEYEMDGKIDFTIEKTDDDTLEFTRLTDEESFEIHKADIKGIKYLKYTNVVILKDKKTIDIPNRVNIDELISFWYA